MVTYMLDTNIIIYLMKSHPQHVSDKINTLPPGDQLVMSFVSYGELLKGANGSARRQLALDRITRLTRRVSVLYPNAQTCLHYGEQAAKLKQRGTPISNNDLWIACHAMSEGAVLVTHNTREFQCVDGLVWEDWATANQSA